jgi:3-oxoacyl-[acyl-carrier-protein] synthase II
LTRPVAITGVAAFSCLGTSLAEHQAKMDAGKHALRPLRELSEDTGDWAELCAGWIEPRSALAGNRYGPATNLALKVTADALKDARLRAEDLRDAWLYVGTSRGNAAGWLGRWPGRRSHRKMAASNSVHSEPAAAISIAHGIRGPYQVISNGCAAGLDAIGLAWMAVATGMAPRALAVSVDLPLLPALLLTYAQTGLLSRNNVNDPYSPNTTGFLPGEAGAAMILEPADVAGTRACCNVQGYWANSDAYDPLGVPADGSGAADCLQLALRSLEDLPVRAICAHASGTAAHGHAEQRALHSVFSNAAETISLHLLKPFTGHAMGASGALDVAILGHYLRQGLLPPNLPGLAGGSAPFVLPECATPFKDGALLKLSAGMGGHNAVVAMSSAA